MNNPKCTRKHPPSTECCAAESGSASLNYDGTCPGCGHTAHVCSKCKMVIYDSDWPHYHTTIECNDRLVSKIEELENEIEILKKRNTITFEVEQMDWYCEPPDY